MNQIELLFNPKSIAIIGATPKKEKVGYAIFKNIVQGGYKGKIYLVNPKYTEIEGFKVYKDIKEINDKVDLAIIAIPLKYVPQLMKELGEAGVKAAVVISAGGRETGEKGKKLEEEIKKVAKKYNIRFLGPNCFGFINTDINLNANFGSSMPLKGDTTFISQSGALFASILDWAINENIGFSYCISIGNMADIEFGELIEYLSQKKNVKRILIYMESLKDAKKFASSAVKASTRIPVVITKAGKSEHGIKAAISHTGAIAGKDFLYSALFKRTGCVRVSTVEDLFNLTEGLSKQPVPKGNRFVILTNAGGPGVLATDRLDMWNIQPADLSKDTMEKLNSVLPPVWSKNNPVDIIGDAPPERYKKALEILLDADDNDGIIGILTPQFMTKPYETAVEIVDLLKNKQVEKPFYFAVLGGEKVEKARTFLEKSNVATYETPEEAVDSMVFAWKYKYLTELIKNDKYPQLSSEEGKKLIQEYLKQEKMLLTEYETKLILKAYGIAVNKTLLIEREEEIDSLEIKFPVVVKIHSPDIIHKTEAGGVILNIENKDQLKKAFRKVIENVKKYKKDAKIEGVIVEEEVKNGFELILGSAKDKIFGQYIMFGFGGIYTEFIKDVSFDFPPLSYNFAKEMIKETKTYKLLKNGFRNIPPANLEKLTDTLIKFSYLVYENPAVEEIDINPLIVSGDELFAVDGRIKLSKDLGDKFIMDKQTLLR